MTISVLQERGTDTAATVSSLALAFTSNVTAGSSIHVTGTSNVNGTGSFTDNNGGTYTRLGGVYDTNNSVTNEQGNADSHAAGATTVTYHPASTVPFVGIAIREIGGTSGYDSPQHSEVLRASPGTTTNAITGTAVTPSAQPGLISVFVIDPTAADALTSGTGYTLGLPHGTYANLGGMISESLRYTATTALTATATDATNGGTHTYSVLVALYKESAGTSANLTAQTSTSSVGTISESISYTLGSQTATFTEGTISASTGGNVTLSLSGQTATFTEGALSLNIGYSLNDGVPLTGQTATFAEGTVAEGLSYALTAQSATLTEGIVGQSVSYTLTGQTATFTEGSITASAGGNVNASLSGQTVTSTAGTITASVTYAITGQTSTSSEGTLTRALSRTLTAQTVTFAEGTITVTQTGNVTRTLTGLSASFVLGVISSSGGVTPKNVMPNLIGLNFSEAQQSLQAAGILNLSTIGYFGTFPITPVFVLSPVAPGIVTGQSIAAGTPLVPVNTPITLTMAEYPFGVACP